MTTDRAAWDARGAELSKVDKTNRWDIADWLAAGDTKWGGSAYDEAQRLFPDYSRKLLMEWAYVARNVPKTLPDGSPVRQEKLSFTHHQVVAALEPDEQQRWLNDAVTFGWKVGELRSLIKQGKTTTEFAVEIPALLHQKLEEYAKSLGKDMNALVIDTLQALLAPPVETVKAEIQERRELREMTRQSRQLHSIASAEWKLQQDRARKAYIEETEPKDVDLFERQRAIDIAEAQLERITEARRKPNLPPAVMQKMDEVIAKRREAVGILREKHDAEIARHTEAWCEWKLELCTRFPDEPPTELTGKIAAQLAARYAVRKPDVQPGLFGDVPQEAERIAAGA